MTRLRSHTLPGRTGKKAKGTDTIAKAALYEIIGTLEGRNDEELDDYRTRHLIADALDIISPAKR